MKLSEEYPLDIVIPVFNEGASIIEVIELLELNVKTKFRILICYDFEDDNTLAAINNSSRICVIEFIKNIKPITIIIKLFTSCLKLFF